jgi:altronate dehydratase
MSEEAGEVEGMRSGKAMALTAGKDGVKLRELALLPQPASMKHLPAFVSDRVALVVPTSLCSSQVSLKLTNRLNDAKVAESGNLSKVATLPHTEGCGASSGASEDMFVRTILGYAAHPMVSCAMLVEHGCEKTHNSVMSTSLVEMGIDPKSFGYASIQLDGGIEGAATKVDAHIRAFSADASPRTLASPSHLRVAFAATSKVPPAVSRAYGAVARAVVDAGGLVVAAGTVIGADFMHSLLEDAADGQNSTLAYGQKAPSVGLHTMHAPTLNMSELLTGLGATGVEVMVAFVEGSCVEPQPLVPIIQTTHTGAMKDVDFKFDFDKADEETEAQRLADYIMRVYERDTVPKLFNSACTHVQISRGMKGISL